MDRRETLEESCYLLLVKERDMTCDKQINLPP